MNKQELLTKIKIELSKDSGQKAKEIAKKLSVERRTVNQILYAEENEKIFERDDKYRWSIRKTLTAKSGNGVCYKNGIELYKNESAPCAKSINPKYGYSKFDGSPYAKPTPVMAGPYGNLHEYA